MLFAQDCALPAPARDNQGFSTPFSFSPPCNLPTACSPSPDIPLEGGLAPHRRYMIHLIVLSRALEEPSQKSKHPDSEAHRCREQEKQLLPWTK
ncbi:hypothetical protein VTH06DRAFT_3478 [Thermothelomyces fergusii]